MLEALARVLGLDAAGTQYLLGLAAARPAPGRARRETVPAGTRQLLDSLGLPAFVESRMFDVLAANRLAGALSPAIRPGGNRLRSIFLDPGEQALHPEWEQVVAGMVASFRASLGTDVADPRIAQLVGELSLSSELFGRLWARHDVRTPAGGSVRMVHPEVGPLELRREKLLVSGTAGQILVVYHAEPGSPSAASLARLASLSAGPEPARAGDGRSRRRPPAG